MSWRLAESLKKLREQINAEFPGRDKSSDGSVGDLSHQARKSDHNPNSHGVVTAIDVDRDFGHGKDGRDLVNALQASRDARIKYIIFERQITVSGDISKWKPYHGANAHNHHVHISVSADPKLYDDAKPWNLNFDSSTADTLEMPAPPKSFYKVKAGDTLGVIARTFKTSVADIKALNGLASDLIRSGQTLRIK